MKKRTLRPFRGQRALMSAFEGLAYEWDMARKAAVLLAREHAVGNQDLVNLLLEAFLLHARNIRDFLAWSNNPNDVVASDFVRHPVRVRMPLLRSRKVRERLNRLVAHLSYSRSRLGREWDVPVLIAEIDSAMGAFLRRLEQVQPALVKRLRGAA